MNRLTNHWGQEPTDNLLDSAIDSLLAEPIDSQAVERVALRAQQLETTTNPLSQPPVVRVVPTMGRKRYWVSVASLAASLLIGLFGAMWLFNSNSSTAFAQVVERIQKIVAVRFTTNLQLETSEPMLGQMTVKEDFIRAEQFNGQLVTIVDAKTKRVLALDTVNKKSQRTEVNDQFAASMTNPIAHLLNAKSKSVQSLGSERMEGRKVESFRIRDLQLMGMSSDADMTLWVDSETQLPTKIVIRDTDPKHKMTMQFDHFDWNPAIEPSTLSLSPPSGYVEGDVFAKETKEAGTPKPNVALDFNAGVLSNSRVPGWIEIDHERGWATAVLRDAESTVVQQRRSNELRQWDLATGKIRWTNTVSGASSFGLCESKGWIALVEGREIQIRELSTGKPIAQWESTHAIGNVAMDSKGNLLAHAYSDWGTKTRNPSGGLEIWNIESKTLVQTLEHGSPVEMVQFSPDGNRVLSAAGSDSIKLWDVATGNLERSFDGRMRAAFSNDGKQLAYISNEPSNDPAAGRIDLFDLETNQMVRSMNTSSGAGKSFLLSVTFSPDNQSLAASDWNGAVTVWDLNTGKILAGSASEKGGVHCVRFVSDRQLVSGSEDGVLRVRNLPAKK